jgi:hypothetical protein
LDHVIKVEAFAYQLACLEILMWEEDIVMTLFTSVLASYEYLITALETMTMKELTKEYIMPRLTKNNGSTYIIFLTTHTLASFKYFHVSILYWLRPS